MRALDFAWPALVLGAASCLSDPSPPSLWPPDDLEIRVAGMQKREDDGRWIWQRFRVTRDGLAVYREAVRAIDGASIELPIFERVSMYRLRPESVRILGRLLDRAGMFEVADAGQEVNRRDVDSHVVVDWTAFGRRGEIGSFVDSGGVLDRVVHVVNSFVPEGTAFHYPELSGEKQPPRLTRVPEPLDWIPGAIICHTKLVELHPDDPDLPVDLFALAFTARDADTARAMFEKIEAEGPVERELLLFVDWEQDCLEPMRALLTELEGQKNRSVIG